MTGIFQSLTQNPEEWHHDDDFESSTTETETENHMTVEGLTEIRDTIERWLANDSFLRSAADGHQGQRNAGLLLAAKLSIEKVLAYYEELDHALNCPVC